MKTVITTLILFIISLFGYAQEYRVLLFVGDYNLASSYEKSIKESSDIWQSLNQYNVELLEYANVFDGYSYQVNTVAKEKHRRLFCYIVGKESKEDEVVVQFNREICNDVNVALEKQECLAEALRLAKCVLINRQEEENANSKQAKDIILYVEKVD